MDSNTAQQPTAHELAASSSSPTTPLEISAVCASSAEQAVEADVDTDGMAALTDDQQPTQGSSTVGQEGRFSAEEKGKGRAVESAEVEAIEDLQSTEPLQANPHYDAEAHQLAESLSAVSLPASPPTLPAPVHSNTPLPYLPLPIDKETAPEPLPKDAPPPEPEVQEERWPLKSISWPPLPPTPSSPHQQIETMGPNIKIVCQNLNGPCSFIALCNVLILRGDIHVLPLSRTSVTYSFLSALVGDHLLRSSSPNSPLSLEAALSILPSTRYGLDLNPRFGHIDGFRQSSEAREEGKEGSEEGSGELALFAMSKVPLLHGWVVDPQDEQTWDVMVEKTGDYDAALEKVVEGQVIAGEQVEDGEEDEEKVLKAVEARSLWTPEQEEKVQQAHLIQKFLSSSRTQLTYHGLFLLSSHLAPSSLSALFRNSHLSVLFRRPSTPTPSSTPQLGNEGPTLFTLVTDESFANEPDVVWESLEDVEGGASEFYDGALSRSAVRGGDWVRRRDEGDGSISQERRDSERERTAAALEGQGRSSLSAVEEVARYEQLKARPDNDYELAQQLQKEENCLAQQQYREGRREDERLRRLHAAEGAPAVLSPGVLSVGPEALAGSEERRMTGAERERQRKSEREKKEGKEKCVVS